MGKVVEMFGTSDVDTILSDISALHAEGEVMGVVVCVKKKDDTVLMAWSRDVPFFEMVGMLDVVRHDIIDDFDGRE